ncbi:MAG: hypothetical protein P9M14_03795 [Candidatus Alcyoniella australis]|nr:hypothetical protein [Candidatus Alcyoniella australis]
MRLSDTSKTNDWSMRGASFLSLWIVLCLLISLGLLAACVGGGSGGGSDDDDDDVDDDDDDDDGHDEDDDDDDDEQPDAWGGVSVSEGYSSNNYQPLDYYCYASASFYDPEQWEGWGDPDDEQGDCKLYTYAGDGATADFLGAGRVTLTGARVSPIYLDPELYAGYYIYRANVDFLTVSDLFDPGDTIRAQVAGGSGIGAADLSVDAPAMIAVTQPSNFDSLSSLPHNTTTFAWSAGDADEVSLMISTYIGTNGKLIECRAPDSQGSIEVDGELMDDLYSSPQTLTVMFSRYNIVYGSGERPVSLSALTYRQRSYIVVD